MRNDADEPAWMSDHSRVSLAELAALSGLPDAMLVELVECGALAPLEAAGLSGDQWTFSARCVVTVRKAGRLRNDFELDSNALAVAISFLERIRELEEQLRAAQAQIPRRFR